MRWPCGGGAVASPRTSARLHGLLDQDPEGVEVLIPDNRRVVRPGPIVVATGADVSRPSTIVVATCADIAGRTAPSGWPSRTTLEDTVLDLADALRDIADGVESPLEFRYVRRVERPHGLPAARRQQVVVTGGRRRRRDNEYQPFGVVVELDGRLGHEGDGVFRDRTRDNSATGQRPGDTAFRVGRRRRATV